MDPEDIVRDRWRRDQPYMYGSGGVGGGEKCRKLENPKGVDSADRNNYYKELVKSLAWRSEAVSMTVVHGWIHTTHIWRKVRPSERVTTRRNRAEADEKPE